MGCGAHEIAWGKPTRGGKLFPKKEGEPEPGKTEKSLQHRTNPNAELQKTRRGNRRMGTGFPGYGPSAPLPISGQARRGGAREWSTGAKKEEKRKRPVSGSN